MVTETKTGHLGRKLRTKICDRCGQPAPILFRVQYDESATWIFVCESCWASVSQNNPFYRYGGTWKARKNQ